MNCRATWNGPVTNLRNKYSDVRIIKWQATGEESECECRKRVLVGSAVQRLTCAEGLLWRHISERAHHQGHAYGGEAIHSRYSEIHNFRRAIRRDHNICRLDIPMNNAFAVRIIQRAGNVSQKRN